MCSPCRTLHRVTKSPSVKRKSPTSAWRRSMPSTRRTWRRLRAAYSWLAAAVMAAVMAAAAEAAAAEAAAAEAAAAEAAAVLAAAAAAAEDADAAVCRGAVAAFANCDRVPITLTNVGHGRVRQGRPGHPLFCLPHLLGACVDGPADRGRVGPQPYRETPARGLDDKTPAAGECALYLRSGLVGNR